MLSLKSLALGFATVTMGLAASDAQHRPEVIERGKKATAFVQVVTSEGRATGSGFCIDRSGLFITNAHVVEGAADGQGQVWLVVDIGRKSQRRLRSRVLKADPAFDLALLRVDGGGDLTSLELGEDDSLIETTPVITFGFPFGEKLKVGEEAYPEITVIASRITSLRQAKGRLEFIQVDNQLNPGNSGGPVLDETGRLIGVAVATVRGAGINLAISVGRLSEFLRAPILVFNPPPLTYKERTRPVTWTVKLQPSRPGAPLPERLAVEVTIINGVEKPKVYQGQPAGPESFQVKVTPVSHDRSQNVDLAARFPSGLVAQVQVPDRDVIVGRQKLPLSDLQALFAGPPPRAVTRRNETVIGPISGLGKATIPNGKKKVTVNLNDAALIQVAPLAPPPVVQAVEALVKAKQDDKVLATVVRRAELGDAPAQYAIALRLGRDIIIVPVPPPAAAPRSVNRPALRSMNRASPGPANRGPRNPAVARKDRVYLCDLQETHSFVGFGALGKNGDLGYDPGVGIGNPVGGDRRIIVRGVPAKKGLSMHSTAPPAGPGFSFARYQLDGKYRCFHSAAAANDSIAAMTRGMLDTPMTFSVVGDGRLLWRSGPIQRPGESQPCIVDVTGVRQLEVRVTHSSGGATHAVWVDPYVQ
jgi:S1-C subfamily serine protease